MSSYIHQQLKNWNHKSNWPYIGSILMVNKDVPLFEEKIGRHDYDWILKVTRDRRCKEIEPSVIRHIDGKNLSLDLQYRLDDFILVSRIMKETGNEHVIPRLHQTLARYYYKVGDYDNARVQFIFSKWTLKNIGYYITSFFPVLAKWVIKKFNVFGCIIL